ncbi:MAG: hypothetical protein AAF961_04965 [Planctomycetota bacterium]
MISCIALLAATGCSDSHEATVSGVANLDGQPLETGMVTFHPAAGGASAYGVLGTGGEYELKTGDKAGLKPGEYYVTVKATEPYEPGPRGATPAIPKTITPARYADVNLTDLVETIEPGANQVDLSLTADANRPQ